MTAEPIPADGLTCMLCDENPVQTDGDWCGPCLRGEERDAEDYFRQRADIALRAFCPNCGAVWEMDGHNPRCVTCDAHASELPARPVEAEELPL